MDWINITVGAGGLVGIVTAFLTYRTNVGERRIKWYDRAIKEIERLEAKLEISEKAKYECYAKVEELQKQQYAMKGGDNDGQRDND